MVDYSASHISTREAEVIIQELNKRFEAEGVRFYTGNSYRHLMVVPGGREQEMEKLQCTPPHDITGKPYKKYLPQGPGAEFISGLMEKSRSFLSELEVNKVRLDLKENPANMIWLWGQGIKPKMEPFKDKFGKTGAVISAVNLINGIGKLIGLKVVQVEGATGYYDTNYQGKAEKAVEALKQVDFVFVHIEAPDEAGHNGDVRMKMICIERIDKLVVGTIMEKMKGKDYRVLITPDHPTPISERTHTNDPVPFLLSGKGIKKGNFNCYDEFEAEKTSLFVDQGHKLLELLFAEQPAL
jgi:2,3-bisphosphoglycerate-independent phosphoglycerate mutase